jgi:hypothetical protein
MISAQKPLLRPPMTYFSTPGKSIRQPKKRTAKLHLRDTDLRLLAPFAKEAHREYDEHDYHCQLNPICECHFVPPSRSSAGTTEISSYCGALDALSETVSNGRSHAWH